jgi:hypothetical protein
MRPVRFAPAVGDDLAEAVTWYDRDGYGAGERFLGEFRVLVGQVASFGHVVRKSYGEFRHLKFPGFPYLLHYREDGDAFFVALVINAARDPALVRQLLAERG